MFGLSGSGYTDAGAVTADSATRLIGDLDGVIAKQRVRRLRVNLRGHHGLHSITIVCSVTSRRG